MVEKERRGTIHIDTIGGRRPEAFEIKQILHAPAAEKVHPTTPERHRETAAVGAEIKRRWKQLATPPSPDVQPIEPTPILAQQQERPISDLAVAKLEDMLGRTNLDDQEGAAYLEEGVATLRQ